MQIVKEIETKTHSIDENGIEHILIEKIEQYHYASEEEKKEHSKEMQAKGFEDIGQVRTNIGSIMQPEYVWFGSYTKYVSVEKTNVIDLYNTKARNAMNKEYDRTIKEKSKKEIELLEIEGKLNDENSKTQMSYAEYTALEKRAKALEQDIQRLSIEQKIWESAREICVNIADEEADH